MFWHRRGTSQKGEKQKAVKNIEGELLGLYGEPTRCYP